MQIIINNTDVSGYLTGAVRSRVCRAENTVYTISGAAKVDRMGGFKCTLTLTFGDLTSSDWDTVCNLVTALPVSVAVTDDSGSSTYYMHLSAELPESYVYSDADGDHVISSVVTLEEL